VSLRVLLCGLLGAALSFPWLHGRAGALSEAKAAPIGGSIDETWRAATWLRVPMPSPKQVWFAAGSFQMGSSSDDALQAFLQCKQEPWGHRCEPTQFANETPPRIVTLSGYWLDRTEVTVRDYQRCVDTGRCRPVRYAAGAKRFAQALFPVSLVRWEDAASYCRFRGGRLPTEAEFERAARGTSGRVYPWGDLYNSKVSNHGKLGWNPSSSSDGHDELAPVGSFGSGASPEGIYDLAGNVAEWVSDRYLAPYDISQKVDPLGPSDSRLPRVVRGGSFEDGAAWLRGAARVPVAQDSHAPTIGFRCARSQRGASSVKSAPP
jgi:formylglycine-generating enzyme required for sulfatase activity